MSRRGNESWGTVARGLIRLCFLRDRWGTESVSARVGSSQATPSQNEQVKAWREQRGEEMKRAETKGGGGERGEEVGLEEEWGED